MVPSCPKMPSRCLLDASRSLSDASRCLLDASGCLPDAFLVPPGCLPGASKELPGALFVRTPFCENRTLFVRKNMNLVLCEKKILFGGLLHLPEDSLFRYS